MYSYKELFRLGQPLIILIRLIDMERPTLKEDSIILWTWDLEYLNKKPLEHHFHHCLPEDILSSYRSLDFFPNAECTLEPE